MAKYKKKRARELKHDAFRDTTMGLFDRLGDRLEGQGRNLLYGILGVIALSLLIYFFYSWRERKADEARHALGRAIAIAQAPISATAPPSSSIPSFTSEKERAQKAADEFQKVADKYSQYREISRYFIATSLLVTDRPKGLTELDALSKSSDAKIATLSKFALAEAKEADAQYDAAAALYQQLAEANSEFVTPDTAHLRLAVVAGKQGKKKEAADILYSLVESARKAKDKDGKPVPESAASREAASQLEKIDPARYAQLPPAPSPLDLQS